MRLIYILPMLLLCGCGPGTTIGTIAGGECSLVHTPKYAVLGKTAYDRNWIVTTEESLVRGCNQPRPLARPASLDRPKAKPHSRPRTKPVQQITPVEKYSTEPKISSPETQTAPAVIAPAVTDETTQVRPIPKAKPKIKKPFFRWKRE